MRETLLKLVQSDRLREMKGYITWVGQACGRELVEIEIVVGRASGLWDFFEL
jgi:hypothetical protein